MGRNQRIPNILNSIGSTAWAMETSKLRAMMDVLDKRLSEPLPDEQQIEQKFEAATLAQARPTVNQEIVPEGVAVLSISGIISQKMNLLTAFSGGTSTEIFGRRLDTAVADSKIETILIDVDSPGGSVYGTQELADKIYAAKSQSQKRIIAIANPIAFSGAYWLGSAADEFIVTPSGEVGSVGVRMMHIDQSRFDREQGVKYTLIHAGEYKVEGNPHEPLSVEAEDYYQQQVDVYYRSFISALARNRKKSESAIEETFGQGRTVTAAEAIERGMVDRTGTFDDVLKELVADTGRQTQREIINKEQIMSEKEQTVAQTETPVAEQGSEPTPTTAMEEIKSADSRMGFSSDEINIARSTSRQIGFEEGKKAGVAEGIEKERTRISSIQKLAPPGQEALADKLISDGTSLEDSKTKLLEAVHAEKKEGLESLSESSNPAASLSTEEYTDDSAPGTVSEAAMGAEFDKDTAKDSFLKLADGDREKAMKNYAAYRRADARGQVG